MATPIEEIGLILSTLRRLTQGESLPRHESDDLDALLRSIKRTVERREVEEFGQIGRACVWLLLEAVTAHLLAERATTLARLVAQGKPEDGGLH